MGWRPPKWQVAGLIVGRGIRVRPWYTPAMCRLSAGKDVKDVFGRPGACVMVGLPPID